MDAVWAMDYDYRTDKCFQRPSCPKCFEAIGEDESGKYHCYCCGKKVDVKDEKMLEWFAERQGAKIEMTDCFRCGGKDCVETYFMRNKVTLEWQAMGGKCQKCGARFIV